MLVLQDRLNQGLAVAIRTATSEVIRVQGGTSLVLDSNSTNFWAYMTPLISIQTPLWHILARKLE